MNKTFRFPALALAALPFLASCAARTPEPRLPPSTVAAQTRQALLAAGLRPGTVEGPRGALRYYEGGQGKTVVLLHGSGSQAGDWNDVLHSLPRCGHMPQVHCPRSLASLLLDLTSGSV